MTEIFPSPFNMCVGYHFHTFPVFITVMWRGTHFSLELLVEAYPLHKEKSPDLQAVTSRKTSVYPFTKYSQFSVFNSAREIKLKDLDPQPASS